MMLLESNIFTDYSLLSLLYALPSFQNESQKHTFERLRFCQWCWGIKPIQFSCCVSLQVHIFSSMSGFVWKLSGVVSFLLMIFCLRKKKNSKQSTFTLIHVWLFHMMSLTDICSVCIVCWNVGPDLPTV